MEILTYTKDKLEKLIYNNAWVEEKYVPITRHKALLLINNPRAGKDDVLLLVSKENNRIIGYRAMFPDYIYDDDKKYKIGWGSCYWVDSEYRGKGIGYKLLEQSYNLYNGSIGSLVQSEMAANVYEKSGKFFKFNQTIGYQFIIKFNFAYWIKRKRSNNKIIYIFANIVDSLLNTVWNIKIYLWKRRNTTKAVKYEYSAELFDKQIDDFISNLNKNDLTKKTTKDINNVVKNNTSLSTPFKDHIKEKYYFDTNEERFHYYCLKLLDHKYNIIGVVIFNINGEVITTPYIFAKEEDYETVTRVICLHILKLKATMYKTYNEKVTKKMKKLKFPIIYKRKRIRNSYLPNKYMGMNIYNKNIHDGDGA